MGPLRAGLVRDTLGSLAVLGVVAFTAFGLPVIDHTLPAVRTLAAAAAPFPVGGGVTVVPPSSARLDVSRTRTGDERGTALFLAGEVRLAVVVTPYRGTLVDATSRLRNKLLRVGDGQVDPASPVRTEQDVSGVRGAYTSAGRPGTYAVFVAVGRSVEVTASGPVADLTDLLPQVDRLVRSVHVGGARGGGP